MVKNKNKNTSICLHLEEYNLITKYIKEFEKKFGFKISIAEVVKVAVREKISKGVEIENGDDDDDDE